MFDRRWLVALCLVAVTLVASACRRGVAVEVPNELMGFWATAAPQYQDRNLEFTNEFVIFWSGPRSASPHRITRVEKRPEEGADSSSVFDVEYAQEGLRSNLEVHFVAAPKPAIHLKNQVGVTWHRIANSSAELD